MSEENKTQNTQVENVDQVEETQEAIVETKNEENQQTQIEQTTDDHKKALRELSSKLKVNLFDKEETEQFISSLDNKVDKAEVEKYQSEVEKLKQTETKYNDVLLENALLKNNVDDTYRPKAEKLIKVELQEGKTLDEAVKGVLEDFPMFVNKPRKAGIDVNDEGTQKSEYDKHLEENYYRGKDGKLYPKTR